MTPLPSLRSSLLALASLVLASGALAPAALAQPRSFTDIGAGLATRDGTIGATEYAGSTSGINSDFGGVLGAGTNLHLDSDAEGNLTLGLKDTTTASCGLGDSDTIVIYIDSRAGGVGSTAGLTDIGDGGRAAVSGRGTSGGASELTFAPGFMADFAIVLRNDSTSLFAIVAGGAHTFIRSLGRSPGGLFGAGCDHEIDSLMMADLGAGPGAAIDYVATLINASNGYRSNEFQGVAASTVTSTIGAAPVALAADDFNTFQTYAVPAVIAGQKTVIDFTGFTGAGFAPTATRTAGQLNSDNWAVKQSATVAVDFGGAAVATYGLGASVGGIAAGGVYDFTMGAGTATLGLQPSGSIFAAGGANVTARLQNKAGTRLTHVDLSYVVYVNNDQGRSTSMNLSWSTDNITFTAVPSADLTTPAALDALGFVANPRSASIPASVPVGGYLYLRWTVLDVAGGGSRDELALDDIVLRSTFSCGDGVLDAGEACDNGSTNGTTPCGCSTACTFPTSRTACGAGPAGLCDAADSCDGAGACVDRVLAAATPCRAAAGPCDVAESCDGSAKTCPADVAGADGTPCNDGMRCNGAEACLAGVCTAGTPVDCGDPDVCTTDACVEPAGSCTHVAIAGCCTSAADCDDANTCTADTCDLGTNRCVHTSLAVAELCNGVDDDCNGTVDDTGNALCAGLAVGTSCTTRGSATFCGCSADAACGSATSGRICDGTTSLCRDGCFGTTRNGCPAGLFCTSADGATAGVCTTACTTDVACAAISTARPYCVMTGSAGTCAECRDNAACASRTDGRVACIGAGNTCAECTAADTTRCEATALGSACLSSGLCGCANDGDCSADRMCDTTSSECVPRPVVDGGTPDAGTDAGAETDAGTDVDAGVDAGVAIDLGRVDLGSVDLGSDASITPTPRDTGGCSCGAAGVPSHSGSGVLVSLGALALLLVAGRRRRR